MKIHWAVQSYNPKTFHRYIKQGNKVGTIKKTKYRTLEYGKWKLSMTKGKTTRGRTLKH